MRGLGFVLGVIGRLDSTRLVIALLSSNKQSCGLFGFSTAPGIQADVHESSWKPNRVSALGKECICCTPRDQAQ